MESVDRHQGAGPSKLVQYCCVAAGHWKKPSSVPWANTLTIAHGGWAFCPFNVLHDGHQWTATGGIGVEQLRRMVRRGKPAGFAPATDGPKQDAAPKQNGAPKRNGAAKPNGDSSARKAR